MASKSQTYRPKARSAGLDIENVNDEIVVYDRTSDKVHLLTASIAKIWLLCDGKRGTVEIADEFDGQEASISVDAALSELQAVGLLDLPNDAEASPPPEHLSRRSMLANAAGASAFAAATIVTINPATAQRLESFLCANVNSCVDFCVTACEADPPFTCRTIGTSDVKCDSTGGQKTCEAVSDRIIVGTCGCTPDPS
jgi:hypothetical protein